MSSAWLPWCAWAGLAAAAAVTILVLGRGWRFFYDEWGIIEYRRSGGAAAFLAPLNGHLVAVPVAVYRVLFATVGLTTYTPYRFVAVLAHVGVAVLLFAYLRRGLPVLAAGAAVGLFLFLGSAWEVLFWMMNLGFVIPMICLVAALLATDRHRPPAEAAGLAAVALASSGLGLAVVATLVADAARRADRVRRGLWLAVPVAGWVVWFTAYRAHTGTPAALRAVPGADPRGDVGLLGYHGLHPHAAAAFGWKMVEGIAGGLVGATGLHWWWPALLSLILLAGVAAGGGRAEPGRVAALLVGAFVYVGSVAVTRALVDQPASSRYLYPGVVFYLLLARGSWKGARLPIRTGAGPLRTGGGLVAGRAVVIVVLMATVAAAAFNIRLMTRIGDAALTTFSQQQVELARLSCPGIRHRPGYQPDPVRMPGVRAGPYRAAVAALGSPVPAATVRRVCATRG